jgi:hypothetical protein
MATLHLDRVVLRSREYDNLIAASSPQWRAAAHRAARGFGGRRLLSKKDYWSLVRTIRPVVAVASSCAQRGDELGAAE